MISSQDFRSHNKVLFSAPVLARAEVHEDYTSRWGNVCGTESMDVIDLNSNGRPDYRADEWSKVTAWPKQLRVEEPVVVTLAGCASYGDMTNLAQLINKQVLTAADFPTGISVAHKQAVQTGYFEVTRTDEDLRPLDRLVDDLCDRKQHPDAQWAFELTPWGPQFHIFVPHAPTPKAQ